MAEWHSPSLGHHTYKGKQLLKSTTWVHHYIFYLDMGVLQFCNSEVEEIASNESEQTRRPLSFQSYIIIIYLIKIYKNKNNT